MKVVCYTEPGTLSFQCSLCARFVKTIGCPYCLHEIGDERRIILHFFGDDGIRITDMKENPIISPSPDPTWTWREVVEALAPSVPDVPYWEVTIPGIETFMYDTGKSIAIDSRNYYVKAHLFLGKDPSQ